MAGEHHVLISPLGRSPGAVSGVYFGLQERGIQVSEVTTVGTSDQDVWRAAQVWLKPLLAAEPGVTYRPRFIASKELRGGEKDVGPFTARMGLYIQQARDAGHRVHVAVTGGRSGMGALGALAAQLYGADHLWHLWVEREIEQNGTLDRLHPPAARTNVYLNPTERRSTDQSKAWELVALPFVDLTPLQGIIQAYVLGGTVPDPDALPSSALAGVSTIEETKVQRANLTRLRELLIEHFNKEELSTLCFDLVVDYDSLGGEGKAAKARELIAFLDRHVRVPELVEYVRVKRPRVPWPDVPQSIPLEQLSFPYVLVQPSMSRPAQVSPIELTGEAADQIVKLAAEYRQATTESYMSVRASARQLAQIFPAGLTVGAADQIVGLAAKYHRAATDKDRAAVFMDLAAILQNAGIYDKKIAERMCDLVMLTATPERMRRLIADAREEDDRGFFRWLSGWLRENEKAFTVPVTVGKFLLDIVAIWIKSQGLP